MRQVANRLPAIVAILLGAGLLAPAPAQAQDTRQRFVGCYTIQLGPWTPDIGGAAAMHTPPARFRLFADTGGRWGGPDWLRASPAILHRYEGGRGSASWTASDSSSIRIVWSDGFTGAELRLFEYAWGPERVTQFWGVVMAFSDARVPALQTPKAAVAALRVPCD